MKKKDQSLKKKIKLFITIFTIIKSAFLIFQFLQKHPQVKQKLKKIPSLLKKTQKNPHQFKKYLKDFFIPHPNNNHTPSALRPRALISYAVIIILAKIFISAYLFIAYPTVLSAYTTIETEIINLINSSRAEVQAVALTIDPELERAAQAKADDLIAGNYFAHFGPDGKKPWDWIDYEKYPYSIAGENLAKDFVTTSAVHRALMVSSTHKKNILNPHYRHLGLGIATGKIDDRDTLVLVQMFGARVSAPSILSNLETREDIKENLEFVEAELFGEPNPTVLAQTEPQELSENLSQIQAQNIEIASTKPSIRDWTQIFMQSLDYLMFALLTFLILALLLNVFIQIRIQKPKTILTTLLVIGLILFFMFTNFHYLEGLARVVSIE